jgi:hypothetical protein
MSNVHTTNIQVTICYTDKYKGTLIVSYNEYALAIK